MEEQVIKKKAKKEYGVCCVCGEEHGLGDLHDIQLKKENKKICKECVDIIHGLV
jgi:hypothetical protein